MYFLARARLVRERVYGSQLSLLQREEAAVQAPPSAMKATLQPPSKSKPAPDAKTDYSMPLSRLPAPDQSHFSGMSYGASGVWVGTRFVASEEAGAPKIHKQLVLSAGYDDVAKTTIYSGRPMHVRKTPYVAEW